MVRDRWQFSSPPFDGSLEPAAFHAGVPQEESLARLEWLLAQGQRCGLVVGGVGMGKSHVAAMAVRRLAGLGAEVAVLSLRGLPEGDWIDLLLERLPLDPRSRAEPLRPWQKLENRLRENTLMERPTALIFDDIDQAPTDAVAGIARLVAAAEPRFSRTLVIATATPQGLRQVPDEIRQRAAVRIEVDAWSEEDVAGFLAAGLRRVGGDPAAFSPQAVTTLTKFAAGVPRDVCRLAGLAVVAAAGDGLEQIDAATIERVWRELAPAERPVAEDIPADEQTSPSQASVRVVRRLWA
jgi:type II secretory pathway predicted ATPase ExeA